MRLDHLLSKEQLDGEGRPVARAARLGGGVLVGGDTGEFSSATAGGLSTHRGDLVVERCCWCGWWEMVSTLLGPEGTTVWPAGRRPPKVGAGLLFRNDCPGMAWSRIPLDASVTAGRGLVWGCGLWVGCWLRIAQWTRASCFLWLSCQGRTVDALAPGADEGRGRPR